MLYAQRLAAAHGRIRNKFGAVTQTENLFVWHKGARIPCYQSTGRTQRNLMTAMIVNEAAITVCATKVNFTSVPVVGDEVKYGTSLEGSQTLRIDTVNTTTIRPFYELDLIDPNKEETAA